MVFNIYKKKFLTNKSFNSYIFFTIDFIIMSEENKI